MNDTTATAAGTATTIGGLLAGVTLADVNAALTFVSLFLSCGVGVLTVRRFWKTRKGA